eukprot:gene36303-biopygen25158
MVGVCGVWVAGCPLCPARFGTLRRRHHCRRCGAVVCGRCSTTRVALHGLRGRPPHRVCDACAPPAGPGRRGQRVRAARKWRRELWQKVGGGSCRRKSEAGAVLKE